MAGKKMIFIFLMALIALMAFSLLVLAVKALQGNEQPKEEVYRGAKLVCTEGALKWEARKEEI